jgi:hypothetical protein
MTKEQIREKIASSIALSGLCEWTNWDTLPQVYKDEVFYPLADQILAIDGIEIKSDDQSLPENNYEYSRHGAHAVYQEAQQHLIEAGFIKCERGE